MLLEIITLCSCMVTIPMKTREQISVFLIYYPAGVPGLETVYLSTELKNLLSDTGADLVDSEKVRKTLISINSSIKQVTDFLTSRCVMSVQLQFIMLHFDCSEIF